MKSLAWDRHANINIFKVIRLHIVAGGFVAFLLGVLLAMLTGSIVNPTCIVLGYLVVFFGDLSTHYSNDYFDATMNAGGEEHKTFGGSNVLLRHPELGRLSRFIAVILAILSNAIAALCVLLYGVPREVLIITTCANLLGWFYSAPPVRLSSRGLGEIAIAGGTGLIIPSCGYLVTMGHFDSLLFFLAIPFIMYGFILSLSLEIPDMETDLRTGKNNLVVRKGRRFAFLIIMALSSLATITFLSYANGIIAPTVIDLRVVTAFSCVPLFTALLGFLHRPEKRQNVNHLSSANIVALFIFIILTDVYFTTLVLLSQT